MVLIIGATGYVGRYLSIYLKEQGYDVLALGRSKKVQEFFKENGVPFQHFDLSDDESFNQLPTENIEAVIDLSACLAEHETPVEKFFEVNTIGVYKMLEFCRKNGIKKFLLSSSHKVYNDIDKKIISEEDGISFKGDHSPYIISKIAAENFVTYYHKDFGIEGIVLRFTGVHGYGEILGHLNTDGTYKKSTFEIFFERILRGDKIEVWGKRKKKVITDEDTYLINERRNGLIKKMIRVPKDADLDDMKAKVEDGLLVLTIPRVKSVNGAKYISIMFHVFKLTNIRNGLNNLL